jgi:hypothetical protein
MANMSYCKFENTANDFKDCLDTLREACSDGLTVKEFMDDLSSDYERRAFTRLVIMAKKFADAFEQMETEEEVA